MIVLAAGCASGDGPGSGDDPGSGAGTSVSSAPVTSPTGEVTGASSSPGVEGAPPGATVPPTGASFHIQYEGAVDFGLPVDVYDLDGDDTAETDVRGLRDRGVYPICYLSIGTVEDWRADASDFPAEVIGEPYEEWPGERWLDIRRHEVLLPIMSRRIENCADKGFLAIDPDSIDVFSNDSGFGLTEEDAVAYMRAIADIAHEHGLAIGLKNAGEIVPEVVDLVDFAVLEQCLDLGECDWYAPVAEAGKAVFDIEYVGRLADVCAAAPAGFTVVRSDLPLSGAIERCA
ncbi:endo alpha-1,4 polygalactosaminidase [Brevibacterium sp. CS2]|uniref:endo alpha-1,4 polygalactosaminidase n=1 Tax=Brevibacterium sp. CS2 TaxID=2575923 RepID=UPI00158634BA|nr:endo alpha-1,4 polygalactosaminidase [Brevibacterium sp. CS2]